MRTPLRARHVGWSAILALSGFAYNGASASLVAAPLLANDNFNCFWSTGAGWGTYSLRRQAGGTAFAVKVLAGTLACRSCEIAASGAATSVEAGGKAVETQVSKRGDRTILGLQQNPSPGCQ